MKHLEFATGDASSSSLRTLIDRNLRARAGPDVDIRGWAESVASDLASGRLAHLTATHGGQLVGLAVWTPNPALGANVQIFHLLEDAAGIEGYGRLLDAVERTAGPIAFLPGPLPGLASEEESGLLVGRRFARYGRSEMVYVASTTRANVPSPGAVSVRPTVSGDEPALAQLHRAAYAERFDRFLFLERTDEREDSAREVHDLLNGRWGPLDPAGSLVGLLEGRLVGAVTAVQRGDGVLIADVAVDPAQQGRGVGRAVLSASLAAMVRAGRGRVYLNVTEGNERALRLYRSLGFVRSLGPSQDWYNTRLIPVSP